ncbi:MAG: rhodanese-like domain-containing protein [Anaerolineae bacterium]|nr:rhodanese-like domain-containing protein [Anaerolineae bacterium]
MLLRYFYDERLAQASYLVGCPATGEAIIIDPARDIMPYLQAAQAHNLLIVAVTETHIHADFVSGLRELAAATGAQIYVSGMGGPDWTYELPDEHVIHLRQGDAIQVGDVRLDVLHTPGHTPEHIAFQVTDTAATTEPLGIFTGDFLFAGDVGRPDLLEVAAGYAHTAEPAARQQFHTVQQFKALPDYLHIFPGHGAGSVCGKALGAVPSTTLGYEKRVNPAFQFDDETAFAAWLLAEQPEAPRYFARMKHVNRVGPTLLRDLPQAQHINDDPQPIVPPGALFIDTRPPAAYARRHIPGTVNIPISAPAFNTYVGWYVDYATPVFFIAFASEVLDVLNALLAIGVDNIPGYFTPDVLEKSAGRSLAQVTPAAAHRAGYPVLDVRGLSEYASRHIPGALHIPMGLIPQRLAELPADGPLVVQCGTGIRSAVVASLLLNAGYSDVLNLTGGLAAWQAEGLPLVQQ